jgi:hypothetical protein
MRRSIGFGHRRLGDQGSTFSRRHDAAPRDHRPLGCRQRRVANAWLWPSRGRNPSTPRLWACGHRQVNADIDHCSSHANLLNTVRPSPHQVSRNAVIAALDNKPLEITPKSPPVTTHHSERPLSAASATAHWSVPRCHRSPPSSSVIALWDGASKIQASISQEQWFASSLPHPEPHILHSESSSADQACNSGWITRAFLAQGCFCSTA